MPKTGSILRVEAMKTGSTGQTGILTLNYDKLPSIEVTLKIDDDRIFLNEKRHFVMKATVCN